MKVKKMVSMSPTLACVLENYCFEQSIPQSNIVETALTLYLGNIVPSAFHSAPKSIKPLPGQTKIQL